MLLKKKRFRKYIIDNIEISSESNWENSDEENFYTENSNKENSEENFNEENLKNIKCQYHREHNKNLSEEENEKKKNEYLRNYLAH